MKSGTDHPRTWFAFLLAIVLTLVVAMINVGGEATLQQPVHLGGVDETSVRK